MHRVGRFLPALALVVAAASCTRTEKAPERTEPWLAPAAQKTTVTAVTGYAVAPESELAVSLPASKAKLAGRIAVVTGQLQVDLLDLAQTRGRLRVDVASIEMEVADDVAATRRQTSEARNWLDLGSAQPEAKRELKRWAEFVITAVEPVGATAAHEGKRRSVARPAADHPAAPADVPADTPAEPAEPAARPETREVRLRARGELTFHGFRVEHTVRLRARFHYPGPAAPDVKPNRIEIESRAPLRVPLVAHDVKPRDAAGTFVSSGMKLLGTQVAREARVSIRLVALPAR